jgi:hypothetical protein
MASSSNVLFELARWALLIAPLLALTIFSMIRRRWPVAPVRIAVAAAMFLGIFVACLRAGVSFIDTAANLAVILAAYAAYCLIALTTLQIPRRLLRVVALVVAMVPIAFGYILATVGALVLAIVVSDIAGPSRQTQEMRPGLVCDIRLWGGVPADSGYVVSLYRTWPFVPLLRYEAVRISIDQTGPGMPRSANCQDALAQYDGGRS